MASPSTYLKVQLQAAGENDDTWGDVANAVFSRLEEGIARRESLTLTGASYSLDDTQYAQNESRSMVLDCGGSPGATCTITAPDRAKMYIVLNNTGDSSDVIMSAGAGTNVTVAAGEKAVVLCDGSTNVEKLFLDSDALTLTDIPATEQAELAAIDALSTTAGIIARTADATWTSRTVTGTTNLITVSNGDGVSGNPTINVGANVLTTTDIPATEQTELAALDALAAGVVAKTGDGTYSPRTITGTANEIVVTNGNGVSGNPTLSLHGDVLVDSDRGVTVQAYDADTAKLDAAQTWTAQQTFGATAEGYTTDSSSSGTCTLDLSTDNVFSVTLTENITTFTWSNPPSSGTAYGFTLKVIQDSVARTITWPTGVDWAGASAPTLSSGSGDVDIFTFFTHDGGTTWYGFIAGQDMG